MLVDGSIPVSVLVESVNVSEIAADVKVAVSMEDAEEISGLIKTEGIVRMVLAALKLDEVLVAPLGIEPGFKGSV